MNLENRCLTRRRCDAINLAEPCSMTEQKFEQRHRFMVSDDYTVGKVASDMSPIDCQSGMSGKCLPVKGICHLYKGTSTLLSMEPVHRGVSSTSFYLYD